MSRAFGPSYARGELDGDAVELLPASHRDAAARRDIVARAAARSMPAAVRQALRSQNTSDDPSEAQRDAIAALDAPDLSVVVTGQQVGLFVGPLYSLWKAATAIAWADRLQRESGTPVIPIFWLQTEDHDLVEVATATLTDGRGGVHECGVASDDGRARVAIAHRTLDADVEDAIARAEALLNGLPHAEEAVATLRDAYQSGTAWSDAFAALLRRVFADTRLLVLQPRTDELAALAAPVHRWATEQCHAISDALTDRAAELDAAGFAEQVPCRTDCALSFFHADSPDGPRHRLRVTDQGWALADGTDRDVTRAVQAALQSDPLRFSSSALLRPLVQDTLLPTAAYVGGPGEISYWAQLAPLYAMTGLPLPMVIPRASGVIVDPALRDDLDALGIAANTIDCDVNALLSRLGPPKDAPEFDGLADRVRAAVVEALAPARDRADALPPHVLSMFDKTADNAGRGAEKLEQRLRDAALRSDRDRVDRVRRVVARLRPNGKPQDRSLCWVDIAARVGVDAIGPLILDAVTGAVETDDEGRCIEVNA